MIDEEGFEGIVCFVCGAPEEEAGTFIECEDGWMCPDCTGEIEDLTKSNSKYNIFNEEEHDY